MAFNSTVFIFVFAPIVLLLSCLTPTRAANLLILAASLLFYGWGEPRFLFVVLASSMLDYGLGSLIVRMERPALARWALAAGVLANIALLIYCKYSGFFLSTLGALLGGIRFPLPELLLPLGISFIVFEKITYLVDVYRRVTPPAKSFADYLFFVFFFPKMLAGPIIKYHEIRAQIETRSVVLDDVVYGVSRFILGLAKKVLIADSMAGLVESVFSAPTASIGFDSAWLAALCFTVQIYFDFSGYSDMAIGLARIVGFRLRENFNQPYLAVGFTDFWERWHISLSTWIRDYLYIPLGGNRRSLARVTVNLWICFLASGLWHGANWTFVCWGAFHGFFVWSDRVMLQRFWRLVPRPVGMLITFVLVVIGWVIFRARTIHEAIDIIAIMLTPSRATTFSYLGPTDDVFVFLALGLLLSFLPITTATRITGRLPAREGLQQLSLLALGAWSFGHVFATSFTPFLYFRF